MVIHYDPWWDPAVRAQATDRAHRIGQRSSVQVYDLIAKDTVEEKILDLQSRKAELMDAVTGDTQGGILDMSKEELLALFDRPKDGVYSLLHSFFVGFAGGETSSSSCIMSAAVT